MSSSCEGDGEGEDGGNGGNGDLNPLPGTVCVPAAAAAASAAVSSPSPRRGARISFVSVVPSDCGKTTNADQSCKWFFKSVSKAFSIPVSEMMGKIRFVDIFPIMVPKTWDFYKFYALLLNLYYKRNQGSL